MVAVGRTGQRASEAQAGKVMTAIVATREAALAGRGAGGEEEGALPEATAVVGTGQW